jgi:hypothetical protein
MTFKNPLRQENAAGSRTGDADSRPHIPMRFPILLLNLHAMILTQTTPATKLLARF